MGYYDNLYKSVYDSVYQRNFSRDSAWKMAKRAANIAVYDAQQRDVRSAEGGSGRLSTVYKALMAGQTVTPYKPPEKRVETTVGESIGAIYRAAGVDVNTDNRTPGTGGWLTQNIGGLTPKQSKKIAAAVGVLHAGGTVTAAGKIVKPDDAKRLLMAYGELPSQTMLPQGTTPYLTISGDGQLSYDIYHKGQPADAHRFDKYLGVKASSEYAGQYQLGFRTATDKITKGEGYDVVRYQTMVDGKTQYKAVAVPHQHEVKYKTQEGVTKTQLIPQMSPAEKKTFEIGMMEQGHNVISIGDAKSMGEGQLKAHVAKGNTGDLYHSLIVTQNLQKGNEIPQLITDHKKLMELIPNISKEDAQKQVSRQVKKYKAEAAVFGVTLTKDGKAPTTKTFKDGTKVVEGGLNVPSLDEAGTKAYQDMGYTVTKTGGTIINFKGGPVGLQGVTLSPEAQAHYAKLGVSVQNVSASGQTTAGHGVRRSSRNPYGGKSAIGTAWGAHKASVLSSARGIVEGEQQWMAEQEKRAAEWDEYYAWVDNQEKLYEAQKKAEEKAEKEYQEALTKFKKEQNKEGIEAWASATPYRRDRVQKPRRRAKQNIIQDAQASMNWGKLSNPFESTSGGVLSPYQRQSRRRVISKARGRQILPQGSMFRTSVMGDKPLAKRIRKGPKAAKRVTRVDYFSPAYALAGFYMPQQRKKGGKKQ